MDEFARDWTDGRATLVDLLRWRAQQPEQGGYTFLMDGEAHEVHLTYAELDQRARAIGARLQQMGVTGERALLLYPPGLEYVAAFFGCLYAGVVAVPAYPPNPARMERTLPRLLAIAADAQPLVALTTAPLLAIAEALGRQTPEFQRLRWLATDTLASATAVEWQAAAVHAETLALLQYTSGSTATPKGVMITHGNLLHNSALIQHAFGHSPASQGVIWLPPYHDMGLIGGILQPLYAGFPVTLMSPIDFLQRPFRWLQAVSRYGATTSGGPNFAYDLCVRKITPEQRTTLDLSRWRLAFNGAETVRPETMERFAATFAPCGFRSTAFYPCYGLAEATLIVSGGQMAEPPNVRTFQGAALEQHRAIVVSSEHTSARSLTSCGQPLVLQRVVVTDLATFAPCPPGVVGEIWVAGPSVAQGYWNRPTETEQTFQATLTDTGEGRFVRTGDLGFLYDNELFITGRLKDLIIIRGRNHYPQDIELTVEQSHPALRPGCGAAFAIDVAGAERLVVVQEVERQYQHGDSGMIVGSVREAMARQHEVQPYAIVLIKAGSIPKTSSGKIQRHACRSKFLDGSLEIIDKSLLADEVADGDAATSLSRTALLGTDEDERLLLLEAFLRSQVGQILHVEPAVLDPQQPLSHLGLDSLAAIELAHGLETSLGIAVPMTHLLEGPSLAQLASELLAQLTAPLVPLDSQPAATSAPSSVHPPSYGQRALWFLHQLAPESAAYTIARAVQIKGTLDLPALRQAFQRLVDRHPTLRTTFIVLHGEPMQLIHEHMAVSFQVEDVAAWSDAALHNHMIAEAHRPFDLQSGPLMRVKIYARSAQNHLLALTLHHSVVDLWSLMVLIVELRVLYPAAQAGIATLLPPLTLQYTDYVRWQTHMLVSPEGERHWEYWKHLQSCSTVLNLPTDRARPPIQTYAGTIYTFTLDPHLTRGIKALAREYGATLYMTLLAAFQVLLYRYTGQHDLLIGSPTAGRMQAGLADLVGYFVNPVVLQADLSHSPSFSALLARTRQQVLAALAHQEYPFTLLVERLQPERDPSRSPLFQVMFVLEQPHQLAAQGGDAFVFDTAGGQMRLGDLVLETFPLERRTAQFDLTLTMVESDNTLTGALEYNSDLFVAETIVRMAGHFQSLVQGIVANVEQRVTELPLLSSVERRQLLLTWNATQKTYPQDGCLHELVEAQVAQTPDVAAVVFADTLLTYQELNDRANQLARSFQTLGVGPEVRVGICLERSLELVIGLLGILKAGGAYVPFDPTFPADRLAFMIADSQVPLVLTRTNLAAHVPAHDAQLVYLDAAWATTGRELAANVMSSPCADNTAYVIYTSGSTGRPKGVMNTHGGICNRLLWMQEVYQLAATDSVLQKTPYTFDVSVWEFFWPLLAGARLILARPEGHRDSAYLVRLITEQRITTLHFVPSMLHVFLDEPGLAACSSVQRIICSGEALPFALQQRCFALLDAQLHNLYGPTEAAVEVTFWDCVRNEQCQTVPIGRPIANTQIYLLNSHLAPVPIGIPGELYIGGVGVARGYVHQAALTAEKFIPNPFAEGAGVRSQVPGASAASIAHPPSSMLRLYRTGDQARYLPDGAIEYLGRLDDQVKIRGFRIEPDEIVAVLGQHPVVERAVVLLRDDGLRGKRLVAYIVRRSEVRGQGSDDQASGGLRPDTRSLTSAVRAFLKEKLPDYMVPSAFVVLEALPLTHNGKIDRSALPLPENTYSMDSPFVAPRNAVEDVLAGIWAAILRLEQIGVHDNFFAIGGHSLLATQVITRVREVFQVELPISSLFTTPTIAGLAEVVAATQRHASGVRMPPLQPIPHAGLLPLSFAQQRLWLLDRLQPDRPIYIMPAVMRLSGLLDVTALQQSLCTIVGRHEVLRTTFMMVQGTPVQVIAPAARVPLLLFDLTTLPAPDRDDLTQQLISSDVRRPFDLAAGPLLRVMLLRLAAQEHVVILMMHHIVADGWSTGVLIREIVTLYAAFVAKQPVSLPNLPIQYADYALWQRTWLQGPVLDAQLAYWRQQLDELPALEFPTDHPRPSIASSRGRHQHFVLSAAASAELRQLSRQMEVTLFMTLLAAWQTLLARYSGQDDIVIGSPIANRTSTQTEELIGCFVNILVLRNDLAGNPSFRTLLQRVRLVCLDAYAHQDVPFEMLVEMLQPVRDLSRHPLFQVTLALQNMSMSTLALSEMVLEQIDLEVGASEFDLSLTLKETDAGLAGTLVYSTDLFADTTITHMIAHFEALLVGIVTDPDQRLADLPLLTAAQRRQVLLGWNATQIDYRNDLCLHQLIALQAARRPDTIALRDESNCLTYAELDARANQLAHYLQVMGVGPEVLVGICVERSVMLVVGILGVLKAGGAYVPLDPTYPTQRLKFMLFESKASFLLTQAQLREHLPGTMPSLCLDTGWKQMVQHYPTQVPICDVRPDNLAYIIYTSGSSGTPKGAMITHYAICNHMLWMLNEFPLSEADRLLQRAALGFDAAVAEIYTALLSGAQLIMARPEAFQDAAYLVRLIAEHRVSVLQPTPTLLWLLLNQPEIVRCTSVRLVLCGGEPMPIDLPELFYAQLAGELYNVYGPTETTIESTFGLCERIRHQRTISIGRPIANTQIYLLDRQFLPVPLGGVGEIYIGGAGLARGYLNRPDLTAERFIPNPFTDVDTETRRLGDTQTGRHADWETRRLGDTETQGDSHHSTFCIPHSAFATRLYRTGDLARYRPDGTIEHIGRSDTQVKIRGFRIELGEIEAVLGRHPEVHACVVLAREDVPGEKRLVAYIVQRPGVRGRGSDGLTSGDLTPDLRSLTRVLRAFLKERLPDYIVPSAFVLLDALPLTAHGKVDYRALPAPSTPLVTTEVTFVAPQTATEELLADIWSQVLRVERVGRHDNFFELGGHSLLATQAIARVRDIFQIELPLYNLFEAPTIAALAVRIEQARQSGASCQVPPIQPVPRIDAPPLSFAQQRLWFLDQFAPDSATYNIAAAVRLIGALDVSALRRSFSAIVQRHEALRTTFMTLDNHLIQVITAALALPIRLLDLGKLPAHTREVAAQQIAAVEGARPFDLAHGPLLRVMLLRLADEKHLLLLTIHHIIADGWSIGVIVRELAALYGAAVEQRPAELPNLPIQYADYAIWQRAWLQGPLLETELSYWKQQLADVPTVLALPTNRPRSSVQTFHGAHHDTLIPLPLLEMLQALSRHEGVTLFMTLLAAFQTLLARYSGQTDLLVGSPIAGRTHQETEGLIGFFVNTLVLRANVTGNPSFRDLLQQVREVCLQAYAHQHLPFERLVEEVQPVRDLSRSPLFQVLFALQNTPLPALALPGLTICTTPVATGTTKFDLSVALTDTAAGLAGTWEYNTDLFDAAMIMRMCDHFTVLLDGIAANADRRLADLPLLTETERQVLVTWNATHVVYPQAVGIHLLIAAQAMRTPDAVALIFEDHCLSYQELAERANRLTRCLRMLGIGPEARVAICMERAPEMVAAMLGVLHAGGSYVPLDPSYPADRLAFMLDDAQTSVLLTQQRLVTHLPTQNAQVVTLDDWSSIPGPTETPSVHTLTPDHPAYVIYTSGSTGRPKGVVITHRALSNHMSWMQADLPLGAHDRVLQKTPIGFDASVWEFYAPLLVGGTLVLAWPGGQQDSAYLIRTIVAQQVTIIQLVPALLRMLLDELALSACASLRRVFCGGETLSRDLAEKFYERLPATTLYNLYGPSEATIDTTWWRCERGSALPSILIGHPIGNAQVYLLDHQLQPVPVGVAGELYVGGAGLARSYLNRPDSTAERFIPNPFTDADMQAGRHTDIQTGVRSTTQSSVLNFQPSPRLYRTGDLARYLPDGAIEFLGRLDYQVKLRGFRIELGEIETALEQHPAVQACVVLAREDQPSDVRLVAYIVQRAEQEADGPAPSGLIADPQSLPSALRAFLRKRLPDYMVPSVFVVLESFPLTANGKLDRRALPPPDQAQMQLATVFVAPRTPIEEVLAGIWEAVLGVAQVGVDDNFFEMGGHSLLATQVIVRVRDVFKIELPLRVLFEAPTIASLATRIASSWDDLTTPQVPALRPIAHAGTAPLSFAQQRLWFLDQLQPGGFAYNISTAVRMTGSLNLDVFQRSLNEIVQRHEVLRTTFATVAGQPLQVIAPTMFLALPVVDLCKLPADERERVVTHYATIEAQQPFDLIGGPLLRTTMLRLTDIEHILLLTMHHIVSDGWSIGVFIRELSALFEAFSAGTTTPLPELPIQYADFAYWQRTWLQGKTLAVHLDYWRERLGGNLPVLDLPADRQRPAIPTFRGANQSLVISESLTEALKELSHRQGTTLFMTLLAAFKILIHRYTTQDDVLIGSPIANRSWRETENLIGCFVNTVVLRTNLAGNPSFRELLGRVREVALGAYVHQDMPFEQLVDVLQPERDLSHNPLFQVLFTLHNMPIPILRLPGLMLTPLEVHTGAAQLDLALNLIETSEGISGELAYSIDLFDAARIARLAGHFSTLLEGIVAEPAQRLADMLFLTTAEQQQLRFWNATQANYPKDRTIAQQFEAQAARTPDATALTFEDQQLSYADLNVRANQLAHHLRTLGVAAEMRVALCMRRSLNLVIGLLGILKAGGAYVPLDPHHPQKRLTFMLEDAQVTVLLTTDNGATFATAPTLGTQHLALQTQHLIVVDLRADWSQIVLRSKQNPDSAVISENLAYVIYTSGSTGRPKGVMINHRNAVNFFTGMDARIGSEPVDTWLAVTSVSFDISVLELLWTLTRGFRVVVQGELEGVLRPNGLANAGATKPIEFSLFYFGSDDGSASGDIYKLLLAGAAFADQHGFSAIWTPERHFHAFGGLYPNPSVLSAAIAASTQRVHIRAGSVVIPLHNPIRVAEEWAVVDNLSHGRVGLSFASGWHADDFVFAPEQYSERRAVMLRQIEIVRDLWRGKPHTFRGGAGNEVEVRILPRPIQLELPFWLTAAGSPDTFRSAGEIGANLLTHLLGQSVESLAEKIAIYRRSWQEHQHEGAGHVTLMLHTFIGVNLETVREKVREPFRTYLRTSIGLLKNLAHSLGQDMDAADFTEGDMQALLDHAFDRYVETSSLFGTPDTCMQMIDRLKEIGVDEVACLIDFGVDVDSVIASFPHLNRLRMRSNPAEHTRSEDYSLPTQMRRYNVTHLQCTPSMINMLMADPQTLRAFSSIRKLLLGGEALPAPLVEQLRKTVATEVHNMYGPTETTIWSTAHPIDQADNPVSIGRPMSNTTIYILDQYHQPVPVGIPGDLFIGGAGLARGYLNRPDLTAERFIPNPFAGDPETQNPRNPKTGDTERRDKSHYAACSMQHAACSTRLYRTGDRARYWPSGNIEFLGRTDQQVKVRGYRIEIGEIEVVLRQHPAMHEVVVIAREDTPGDMRLVAYVVPKIEDSELKIADSNPDADESRSSLLGELRAFLKQRLPDYMLPSAFVLLKALPLTPNGKLDRRALPAPGLALSGLERTLVAPRTPEENVLVQIWAQVLQLEQVGIHDNFFGLGGHSLLATQLISQVRERFRVDVPLRSLFDAPTVAGMAERIVSARRATREVLPLTIPQAPRDDGMLPLSFAQQRLWLLDQLTPNTPTYNVPIILRLTGSLVLAIVKRCIDMIVERHEVLRTTFVLACDQPIQVIASAQPIHLRLADLQAIEQGVRDAEVRRLIDAEVQYPFDLACGPLLRLSVLRLAADEHILLLTIHHIIFDAWSMAVFIRELSILYSAYVRGVTAMLPQLPIQYADYALWQRQQLQGKTLTTQLSYWKEQLAGAPPTLDLPFDRPHSLSQIARSERQTFVLPASLTGALKLLSQHADVTLFMALLAVFDVLLFRYTGQDDIVVGTDVANRTQPQIENLIGFFVNQLVLRTDLSGNPTFRELLSRVRAVSLGAYAHQELPFKKLVDEINPERDLNRNPLFQVVFALQNVPMQVLELPDLMVTPLEINRGMALFDVVLVIVDTQHELTGVLEYNTDLFDTRTMTRLLTHFQVLLEAVSVDPARRIADLPLLTAHERQQMLVEWNTNRYTYPHEQSFCQLFEAQVARVPDTVAVISENKQFTYAQLNQRANRLAHALAAQGVGPEVLVALLVQREGDFLIAMLAVFKAGGAYVPLDPAQPIQRHHQILAQSKAAVVLSAPEFVPSISHALANVPAESRPQVLYTDALFLEEHAEDNLYVHYESRNLAYVIYTSGSTGIPKGAMVEHRGMLNHLYAKIRDLELTDADTVAETASQSFDISVWQFLAALLVGGRVQILNDEIVHAPAQLLNQLESSRISILETVPSLLRVILEEIAAYGPARPWLLSLRWLIPTGEALPTELCRQWLDIYPNIPLLNAYGPTECSDDVTHYPLHELLDSDVIHMPIGRPVSNMRLYILDSCCQPTPIGVIGELYVGGIGVGRGYLNDTARTAEVFIPDPFTGDMESWSHGDTETGVTLDLPTRTIRLYRTGDLARYLPDGTIVFLGRRDDQVKQRGFRIELGEIEAVLSQHPMVRESVVVLRQDSSRNTQLVAYVVQDLQQLSDKEPGQESAEDQEKIAQWQMIFDEVYRQKVLSQKESALNLRVWTNSYTEQQFPEAEIFECVEDSVKRILALQPRHVLEIGCGSGLLLFRIAPHCSSYFGTDVSQEVLDILQQQIWMREHELPGITLLQRAADNLEGIPAAAFDVIILNEVAQYFPSVTYFVRVLESVVGLIRPGGSIFIGGVRSLPLLKAFHTSTQLYQASASLSIAELHQRIHKHIAQEKELVVDPDFFLAIQQHLPQICALQIQLKGGRTHNELTKFRYDVVLHVNAEAVTAEEHSWVDWQQQGLTVATVRQLMVETRPETLCITHIPNARTQADIKAVAFLAHSDGLTTVGELREALQTEPHDTGIDPEELWAIGHELPYLVTLSWSGASTDGSYSATFRRYAGAADDNVVARIMTGKRPLTQSWSQYANNPLQNTVASKLISQLRNLLEQKLPEYMVPAVFVLLEAMPLTPNGKVDRGALPEPDTMRPDLEGSYVAPRSPVEDTLAQIWADALRVEQVGVHDNFFELGGDSILGIHIVTRAKQAGLQLTLRQLFQHQNIAQLALVAGTAPIHQREHGRVTGAVPLTPIQHWFFAQQLSNPHHFNQALLFETRQTLVPSRLKRAVQHLLEHHDALRLRFFQQEDGWQQINLDVETNAVFLQVDVSALPSADQRMAIEAMGAALQASLNLSTGPIMRAAFFDCGPQQAARFLMIIHHLAVDGVSWRVLVEDLQTTYEQLSQNITVSLPPKTISFKQWAEQLVLYAQSPAVQAALPYWLAQVRTEIPRLPIDDPNGSNIVASVQVVTVVLSSIETDELLHKVPAAYHTQINDVLLTALAQTIVSWTGVPRLRIDLEGHGREELLDSVDITRTVGWFTSIFPLLLDLKDVTGSGAALKAVKEQLRMIPQWGISYGVLRYLNEDAESRMPDTTSEVSFNYLGQFDQSMRESVLFGLATESSGPMSSPSGHRKYLLEITGNIVGGELHINWIYSSQIHYRTTIERLSEQFLQVLRALIIHCRAPEAGGYTPSDFPGANLNQSDLDSVLAKIQRRTERRVQ